jgi:hypothetical protein
MIETIEIDGSAEPAGLRKLFRKKAMTGGGFIRLKPGITADECQTLFRAFLPELLRHSLAERVFVALAEAKETPEELLEQLKGLDNAEVQRMLRRRAAPGQSLPQDVTERETADKEDYLRTTFAESQGEDPDSIAVRMVLARTSGLPDDLRNQLARDPVPEIRFHARTAR